MSLKLLLGGLVLILGFNLQGERLIAETLPPEESLKPLNINLTKIYPSLKTKTLHNDIAESYIVLDLNTGETIVSKNSENPYPLASLTKLMTAYLSSKTTNLSRILTVPPSLPPVPENLAGIEASERYSLLDCLRALLVYSANDMAYLLASENGQLNDFVEMMNNEAKKFNLNSFVFVDPAGLSLQNQGSARDVALLLTLLSKNPALKEILASASVTIKEQTRGEVKTFNSTSVIFSKLTNERLIANKTGFLPESGYNYAGIFEFLDGRRLAVVIFKANPPSKQGAIEAVFKLFSSLENFSSPNF